MTITFHASLWKVTVDQDGESKVVFLAPLSELDKIAQVAKQQGKLLEVEVRIGNE